MFQEFQPLQGDTLGEVRVTMRPAGQSGTVYIVSVITKIEVKRYRYPLDPPFHAAWDPIPRVAQEAEIVSVYTDDGIVGHASGDFLPDVAVLSKFVVGLDPLRTEAIRQICETTDFHRARPWVLEVAVWDVVGKLLNQPLWKLLGGRNESLKAYASSGELMTAEERVRRTVALRDSGVGAVKIRFHHADWRDDLEILGQVRDAVGSKFELMVDANQGWRMEGDRSPRWDVATAAQCAKELEKLDVYWFEEPLDTFNVDGWAKLRSLTTIRLAGGEMVRDLREARDLVLRGGIDILQPDVVLTGGIGGCKRIAALAELCGANWSPHAWSNGYGLVANLHAALAFSGVPWIEVPYDDPAWLPARRDWLLPNPIEIAADGTIRPPVGPGLGVIPNFDALEQYRIV
jgi:D-galactarolactone cycloisomerase